MFIQEQRVQEKLKQSYFMYMHTVQSQSSFQLCRQTKTKESLWPIKTDTDNPMKQSEPIANTCSQQQGQENMCEQVMIG